MGYRHHVSGLIGCATVLVIAGCALTPPLIELPGTDPDLVRGTAIFGTEVAVSESAPFDVLGTTPEMLAFVEEALAGKREVARYRHLIDKLTEQGYFASPYDAGVTATAADTFAAKAGNCISYTSMFVALARAANMRAHFQLVDRRFPTWTVDGGMLVRNNHVNVFIESPIQSNYGARGGDTVDFNLVDPDPDAQTRLISDDHAFSLFYANLSVDELLAGNGRVAFSYLRRALELAPDNAELWINLGAMYARYDKHTRALQAFAVAQRLNPREKAALSGMERSYRAIGDLAKADEIGKLVRRYRERNPYYHFAVAQVAYHEGAFQESLGAVDKAIKIKKKNPRFHFMRGLTLYKLGDVEGAKESFLEAERIGRFDDSWLRYTEDMVKPELTSRL